MSRSNNPVYVSLHSDFDWSLVHVEEPKCNEINKAGNPITWHTSSVYVKGANGEKRPIYFQLEQQMLWGISGIWPVGTDRADQTLDTLEGYQITYPMTTINTVNSPTINELKTQKIFDNIRRVTSEAMQRFCKAEKERKKKNPSQPPIIPSPTYTSYLGAIEEDNIEAAVKPIYSLATRKDPSTGKSVVDASIPKKAYIKLKYYKKKADDVGIPKCTATIKGPGNKIVSVQKYLQHAQSTSTLGTAKCVIQWEDIYWGAHGKSPYGCNARIKVVEINYTPEAKTTNSDYNFLGPNDSPGDEEEDDDFPSPIPKAVSEEYLSMENEENNGVLDLIQGNVDDELDDDDGIEEEEEEKPAKKSTKKPVKKTVRKTKKE